MESKLNDDQLKNDPFEISQESEISSSFTLLLRAMGYLAFAGYAVWALLLVSKNISNIIKLETDALTNLGAFIRGDEIIGGGIEGWKIFIPILICIWFACIFIRIRRCCIRVVIWRWKWIWIKVSKLTIWGRIIRLWAFILVFAQFVFCICFTIVTIIIVWINIWVLIPAIF